jgi:outer membrane protein assembly factor BamB
VGVLYGINLGSPVIGRDGTVYVYGTTSTAVVAVDPADGRVKWKYTGVGDGVKKLLAAEDAVYVLTEAGRLYKFGPDGESVWSSPLDLGSGNGGMVLSSGGDLYISRQGAVYDVDSGGRESLLYEGPAGASLELKEITPAGDVILQRTKAGSYALISLSPAGAENWVYDGVQGPVEVACPEEGGVYAVYHAGAGNAYFYVLDGKGGLRSAGLLERGAVGAGLQFPYYQGDQKPVPGSNGVVYFTGYWTFAVDAASGRVLRTIQIKDAYSLMTPQSLSVDEEGVLYGTFGEMGLMAIAENAYYGEQVQLGISGTERVRAGSLAELTAKVKNALAEDKNVIISAAFVGAEGDGPDALTSLEALLAAGEEQEFNLGVRIPIAGDGEIVVSVRDRASGESYASWRRAVSPRD